MSSFQISVSPSRRKAARFINKVRQTILKAYQEEKESNGLTQSEIARRIGTHRSVVNRELRGRKDITLGRLAEIAEAMGREPVLTLDRVVHAEGSNLLRPTFKTSSSTTLQKTEATPVKTFAQ